jgi:hypothetical protein
MSPEKIRSSPRTLVNFLIHPTFCDDIFIRVVYIASVNIGVAPGERLDVGEQGWRPVHQFG